jgi:hypothetical protein
LFPELSKNAHIFEFLQVSIARPATSGILEEELVVTTPEVADQTNSG